MKTALAVFFVTVTATSIALEIATSDGRVFKDCDVKSVEKTGLRIIHRDGTAFLDFDTLPAAIQKKYGWTAEKTPRCARKENDTCAGHRSATFVVRVEGVLVPSR